MKQKWFNVKLFSLMLCVALFNPSQAAVTVSTDPIEPDPTELIGSWTGSNSVIVVNHHGTGIMSVHGIDSHTSFECTGRLIGNTLTCAGFGVEVLGNGLFNYTGRFEWQTNGSLSEAWDALFGDGGSALPRNGMTKYRRGLHLAPAAAGEGTR